VLIIACANVAHLQLARSATRQREFAVRCAIGASRARVVRQLLTESIVLALVGGAAGIALAYGGVHVFTALGATTVPRLQTMALDVRVVAFATVLSVLTGLLFGLAPARAMARVDVTNGLRSEDRGSTTGRASRGTRLWLIGSQVALALVLLAGAGLLLRSLLALRAIDLGFATDRVASFVVSVAGTAESAPGRRGAFYDDVLERLRATPGVASAAAINHMPLVGDMWRLPYQVEGHATGAAARRPSAIYRVASAGYFDTMRIRMVDGRTFTSADRDSSEPVVIVNARLAADAWPGQSAIGKHLRVPFGPPQDQAWRTVIGVSANTVRGDVRDTPASEFFLPLAQNASYRTASASHITAMTFVVRAAGDPAALVPAMRSVVRTLAPDVPVSEVFVMRDVVDRAGDGSRFLAVLLGVFAVVAGALAVLGVFGVISHDVAARRREIGIRLALGATPSRVAAGIARDGLIAAGAGLALGLGAAAALRGALSTLLFSVTPFDPATITVVTAGLATVAVVACGGPAYRAARSRVAETLR
jgi:putative ABC transport system permease protein